MRGATVRVGDRFDRLVVREMVERKPRTKWLCDCDCGGTAIVRNNNLLSGNTVSCGCAHVEHGHAKLGDRSPEYVAWQNMQRRVRTDRNYRDRITICERWSEFENFLADMGCRPSEKHSLERKDNDGPYAPGNCKWATKTEQQNNRRVCRLIEANGERLTVAQWARKSRLSCSGIRNRLKNGWPPAAAVTVPAGGQP